MVTLFATPHPFALQTLWQAVRAVLQAHPESAEIMSSVPATGAGTA